MSSCFTITHCIEVLVKIKTTQFTGFSPGSLNVQSPENSTIEIVVFPSGCAQISPLVLIKWNEIKRLKSHDWFRFGTVVYSGEALLSKSRDCEWNTMDCSFLRRQRDSSCLAWASFSVLLGRVLIRVLQWFYTIPKWTYGSVPSNYMQLHAVLKRVNY